MRELSLFVDESGDFGPYDQNSPYYIFSIVFHDQSNDISEPLNFLEHKLSDLGFPNHCIHSAPLIRSEEDYVSLDIKKREKIMLCIATFVRKADITYSVISVEKKNIEDRQNLISRLSVELHRLIDDNLGWLLSYDSIKLYYDNGQKNLTSLLTACFSRLSHVEFRKVIPANYRLFQVADFLCTIELSNLKAKNHNWSKSEINFFGNEKIFKKKYLDVIKIKKCKN